MANESEYLMPPLLLKQWKAEVVRLTEKEGKLEVEIKRVREKRSMLKKMIEAGTALSPVADDAESESATDNSAATPLAGEQMAWTDAIEAVVNRFHRGLSHEEVRHELSKTPLGEKLKVNHNSYFGAVSKLTNQKRLYVYDSTLYSPRAYAEIVSHSAVTGSAEIPQQEKWPDVVLAFLEALPNGAESSHVMQHLKTYPAFQERLKANPNAGYGLLSDMAKKEKVLKGGTRYYHPRHHKELVTESNTLERSIP